MLYQTAICRQQRYDPRAVITDISDAEVHRGLYDLVTRGLLPKTVDATAAFEGDVLALTGMPSCFTPNPEQNMLPAILHALVASQNLAQLHCFVQAGCPPRVQ